MMMLAAALVMTLAAQAPAQPPPKPFDCTAPEYRQFDFWVQGGCVVRETWDDGIGGTGQSFNLFDRVRRRWHQTWVDNAGSLHQYWGGFANGRMVLEGEVPLPPASRFQGHRTVRVSFIPIGPDQMRQFSESLNVDGTWSPNYDLIYTRRAKAK